MQETAKIWMNGELVDWADATVHLLVWEDSERVAELVTEFLQS